MDSVWNDLERKAWYPPEKLTPSQWTERNRYLPSTVAAESGLLRLNRTAYIRGILDAILEPLVEEIVFLKCTQVGWSTLTESAIGYFIDVDPGPTLLVLDSEKTAKEVIEERIRPLIENTPAIKQHLSPNAHDNTLTGIKFDTMGLYMGWSGSPGTLARRAIRYAIYDEVDKYPPFAGREADPISLGSERTATYGYRRKVLIGSTPTVRTGNIWRAWEAAGDQRRYHVPCPHCGEFQCLVFTQIKYPDLAIIDNRQYADALEQMGLAFYECFSCKGAIRESHKPKMMNAGVWLSAGQTIDKAGQTSGERPRAKRIGFTINSLYSPWRSFSAIAAEHRRSLADPGKLQNFFNSWLAQVWEDVSATSKVEDWRALLDGAPKAGIVPAWAEYVIASSDIQKDRMYWIIRAWGADFKSQLIAYGMATSWAELRKHCLETQYPVEGGRSTRSHLMVVDAGYRTDEVYTYCQGDERCKPVKGDSDNQHVAVKYSTAAKHLGLALFLLNTQLLKDRLSVYRKDKGRWQLNNDVTDEYFQHLASEHKVIERKTGSEVWQVKSSGAANHYLDCEVYQLAASDIARVDLLTPKEQPQPEAQQPEQTFRSQPNSWLGNTSNFLSR